MHGPRTSEKIDAAEYFVLSQEDAPAPEIHRTVSHFEHNNDICCESDFPILETSVFDTPTIFNYLLV